MHFKNAHTLLLVSLAMIVAGGLIARFASRSGTICLKEGAVARSSRGGEAEAMLPFTLELLPSPSAGVASLRVNDSGGWAFQRDISQDAVFRYRGYRLHIQHYDNNVLVLDVVDRSRGMAALLAGCLGLLSTGIWMWFGRQKCRGENPR